MKKSRIKLSGGYRAALFFIMLALGIIIVMNVVLIRRADTARIEAEGQTRLSSIAGRVGNSLYRSECLLDSVAMQIEQILAMGGDTSELLDDYFCSETIADIRSESDGSCFSAYAAYDGRLYINDFVPDDDFVLDERSWYLGAKRRMGAVNVTEPYIDASTGEMCYSISKLLSDGSTIVGLDFNLSAIQQYIEEMNSNSSGTSFIVDANGMIVGHSNSEYIGRDYRELDFYYELVNKVFMLYGNSFDYRSDGEIYNVFSDKTNYDWYLVVCVKRGEEYSSLTGNSLLIAVFMLILSAAIVIFYICICRKKAEAERRLAAKDKFLKDMGNELKLPISRIISRADILSGTSSGEGSAAAEIGDSANDLNRMVDEMFTESDKSNSHKAEKNDEKDNSSPVNHVLMIALVTFVLVATGVVTFIINTITHTELSNVRMEQETEIYLDQVRDWALTNKTVLDVIADSIAAQPHFTEDYASAIVYLDSIASKYDDISVVYICNPEWEHTVFMNNGWEPDANWHVEERQWYIDTLVSRENFNVSAPYLDEQTGLYCTTLSKIVYDDKGNFIGVLGIDYYLDKLIGILGESYTDKGYAFITDIDGNILNHPYEEYQMKPGYSVNAADICYRTALSQIDSDSVIFTDYDGFQKGCLAMKEEISGFNVFVVRSFYDSYGSTVYSDLIYIGVYFLCIVIVNAIMLSITRWQAKVNKELKEAADKAISAGKAKNDFLANMSHEIRTPINAVLGMNEMIMRESGEKQIVEYAANIRSAGRTLLSIINDILDFSKIESGNMEIVPVSYDVSSLVNDIVNMVRIRAEKKKLRFIYEIDENIPSVLYGDDVRIRQVITNILTNAVKYTPEGYVRFRMKVLHIENDILRLEVSVTDTGIGIREEDMEKLFASFQRLDQEKNRSIEGTGLGMSIVQRLLNMMGSELKVSSVYGSGSTFSFEIEQRIIKAEPIGDFEQRFKAAAGHQDTDAAARTAPNARVLVVDDNETNLLVAKSLLKRTMVKLDTAASGQKCIEMLKKGDYDIVFLDHMMPEMDGIETLKKIKEENIAQSTCFIALTANAIHGARQDYLDAGFDDYLSKPFTGVDIEKCLFGHLPERLWEYVRSEEQIPEDPVQKRDEGECNELFSPEEGAKYTGGDMDAYKEILALFVRKAPELSERIERLFNEKDWKNYVIEVHALKSSSLNIGSKELSSLAKELELSGKEGNFGVIEEKNSGLLELYKRVTELGREYLGENEAPEEEAPAENEQLTELEAEKARKYFENIRNACLAFDADEAERLCGEISDCSVGGVPLRPVLDEIMASAEDFEYEAAAETAEKFSEKL
ncbi:MAG: ATP-binding protein [Oscillospiraceae bacterium]|nr:ATP-binding protein [Oscillospiraceae bacterium]